MEIRVGFHRCGRIYNHGVKVYRDSPKSEVLRDAVLVQEKCDEYGSCTLIPGACPVANLITAIEGKKNGS